jgi:hypothetical protein
VNKIKNSFSKLIFILPMLTVMLALSSFTQEITLEKVVQKAFFSQTNSDHATFPSFISLDIEEKSFVYNESETSEFEIELEWGTFYSFQNNFLEGKFEPENKSHFNCFYETSQNIPLYDLFCNWKLNLLNT